MLPDTDRRPKVGSEANMLGIREDETSVSIFLDPHKIPPRIRPKAILNRAGVSGLNDRTVLYALSETHLPALPPQARYSERQVDAQHA